MAEQHDTILAKKTVGERILSGFGGLLKVGALGSVVGGGVGYAASSLLTSTLGANMDVDSLTGLFNEIRDEVVGGINHVIENPAMYTQDELDNAAKSSGHILNMLLESDSLNEAQHQSISALKEGLSEYITNPSNTTFTANDVELFGKIRDVVATMDSKQLAEFASPHLQEWLSNAENEIELSGALAGASIAGAAGGTFGAGAGVSKQFKEVEPSWVQRVDAQRAAINQQKGIV